MVQSPARVRAFVLPAVLIVGLFAASTVSAAESDTPTPRAVTLAGTGALAARGDGHARLAGSYRLAGSLDGGTLEISGAERWTTIRVTGWVSKTRLLDGTVVYRFGERTGHFLIAGRSIVTNIDSDAMRFRAVGRGRATLRGEGSYWVNGRGPLPWSDPEVESDF